MIAWRTALILILAVAVIVSQFRQRRARARSQGQLNEWYAQQAQSSVERSDVPLEQLPPPSLAPLPPARRFRSGAEIAGIVLAVVVAVFGLVMLAGIVLVFSSAKSIGGNK